ncbi:MAG: hypothetical protein QM627_05120 [Luteolibacter sp.]
MHSANPVIPPSLPSKTQRDSQSARSGNADKIGLSLQKLIEKADTIARFVMLYR